jgi:hypothetical protein
VMRGERRFDGRGLGAVGIHLIGFVAIDASLT